LATPLLLRNPRAQADTKDWLGLIRLAKACDLLGIPAEQRGQKVLIPKL
jgi:hypothetical protein